MNLNNKQEELLRLLMAIPPNIDRIEDYIINRNCTADDLSIVGLAFVNNSWREYVDNRKDNADEEYMGNDQYIYMIVELLLKYGLDPNAIYDSENIMLSLKYIRFDYVAADTLRLLIEHGGDINLYIDGERLFDIIDFDVTFDAVELCDRLAFDALVHYWMVMVGYGGMPRCGATPLDTFHKTNYDEGHDYRGFQLSELKNHSNYYVCLTHVPNRGNNWSLHIIDNKTLWEVARL